MRLRTGLPVHFQIRPFVILNKQNGLGIKQTKKVEPGRNVICQIEKQNHLGNGKGMRMGKTKNKYDVIRIPLIELREGVSKERVKKK